MSSVHMFCEIIMAYAQQRARDRLIHHAAVLMMVRADVCVCVCVCVCWGGGGSKISGAFLWAHLHMTLHESLDERQSSAH